MGVVFGAATNLFSNDTKHIYTEIYNLFISSSVSHTLSILQYRSYRLMRNALWFNFSTKIQSLFQRWSVTVQFVIVKGLHWNGNF